jgi:iron complex outermembrane receptor protein
MWTVFHCGVSSGATAVRFSASVENVTDKKYWVGMFTDGFVMPGVPRTYRMSATVSF